MSAQLEANTDSGRRRLRPGTALTDPHRVLQTGHETQDKHEHEREQHDDALNERTTNDQL
jgi:hypothetical protein